MKALTFALLALMSTSALAGAGGKAMGGVSEQVRVEASGGKVIVTLSAANHGTQRVYVPKAVYEDDELIAPVFDIREAGSAKPVEYIGRKVKRGPITADDYLEVRPGATATNSIDITPSYDFLAGRHDYTLAFRGGFLTDLKALDAPTRVPAAPVSFTFVK